GSHTLIGHYDTVHSGKHAIDYLGSYDATETTSTTPSTFHFNNNNPCADAGPEFAAQCGTPAAPIPPVPTDTFLIPAATLVNCGGSAGGPPGSQVPGSIKIFGVGADLTAVSYPSENV